MAISDKLTLLRESKGVYQKELAAYLKVSIGTISNYENGVHEPDLVTLGKLADFYGVSTDYLLERTYVPLPTRKTTQKQPNALEKLFADVVELSPDDLEAVRQLEKYLLENELQVQQK